MSWEKGTIDIRKGVDPRRPSAMRTVKVAAAIYGPYVAVVDAIEDSFHVFRWHLIHTPTGLSFGSYPTQATAKAMGEVLAHELGDALNFGLTARGRQPRVPNKQRIAELLRGHRNPVTQ